MLDKINMCTTKGIDIIKLTNYTEI